MPLARCFLLVIAFAVPTCAGEFIDHVTCVATSRQVAGYLDEKFLVSDADLTEVPPNSGRWVVGREARAWNSNYGVVNGRNDESPIVEFQFETMSDVAGLHVWNMPGPRGFATVTVQYAQHEDDWQFLPEVLTFAAVDREREFVGERIHFSRSIRARKVRLWCHATHRGRFGQPDVAGLVRVKFVRTENSMAETLPNSTLLGLPEDCGIVNVKAPPYAAKGDGITDDTQAIQRAMNDCQATRRYVYLPAGTYLVSQTLAFKPGVFFGDNNIRGAGIGRTIIRLKDHTFTSPEAPQPVISFGYHGSPSGGGVSADWFNNNIRGLTIDVGHNPGAIGLQYYSNNAGAARELEILDTLQTGVIGLDLGYQDQNGPLLVKDVTIRGFDIGVSAGNSVNSQILSQITLHDQRSLALRNIGQCLTVEQLSATGNSPRIHSQWGFLTLVDCRLTGKTPQSEAAVTSGEFLCAVNLRTEGFTQTISSRYPQPETVESSVVDRFFSAQTIGNPGNKQALTDRKMTPKVPPIELTPGTKTQKAVNVRNFRRIEDTDDSAAFQRAIDSGAEIVYVPTIGQVTLGSTVIIRGGVQRITGFQSQLACSTGDKPSFRIAMLDSPQLIIEDLNDVGRVENVSDSVVILMNIQGIDGHLLGQGEVYLENTVGDFEVGPEQRVWSRQLNSERAGTKLFNRGGQLTIIGLKTERGGTLVETSHGGRTEVLGGLCYTTNKGELAPMFVNQDSSVWAAIGEVCYTGNPFQVLVSEERRGVTREWQRGEVPKRFDFLQGSAFVYDGRQDSAE